MKKFTFKKYLTESVIDIARDTLDPTVFSFPTNGGMPVLQSAIKKQIFKDINEINNVIPVRDFYIIGSILTKRYNNNSDIDVNVEVDENFSDRINIADVLRFIKKINGRMATGTTHPINYYILQGKYDLDKTDAAYDVANNKWLKISKDDDEDTDIEKYVSDFQDSISKIDLMTGELRRDINDIDTYRSLPMNKISRLKGMMQNKLEEVEDDIISLTSAKKELHELRKQAFEKKMTPEDIMQYTSQNWLPENITYKLLSKYYYVDFIEKLKKFMDENDNNIDVSDIDDIKKIGRNLWK